MKDKNVCSIGLSYVGLLLVKPFVIENISVKSMLNSVLKKMAT